MRQTLFTSRSVTFVGASGWTLEAGAEASVPAWRASNPRRRTGQVRAIGLFSCGPELDDDSRWLSFCPYALASWYPRRCGTRLLAARKGARSQPSRRGGRRPCDRPTARRHGQPDRVQDAPELKVLAQTVEPSYFSVMQIRILQAGRLCLTTVRTGLRSSANASLSKCKKGSLGGPDRPAWNSPGSWCR